LTKKYVYGPVPSRRLGLSLGIDLTPHKVCDFDCVYCQCGKTTIKTLRRQPYIPGRTILRQIRAAVRGPCRIDFLTFSGSGEPTLNSEIGDLITEIKKFTNLPVCVITNGSLFYKPEVRRAIQKADVVLPTLCAASQKTLDRVNRPHRTLKIGKIIRGLAAFRKEFTGQIWLEVMLVRGLNDSVCEIRKLKQAIRRIKPDKVQLNTVVRPPSAKFALPVPRAALLKIKKMLGRNCEIVAAFDKKQPPAHFPDLKKDIIEIVRRRPETAAAIAHSLGAVRARVNKVLSTLRKSRRIRIVRHRNRVYFKPV